MCFVLVMSLQGISDSRVIVIILHAVGRRRFSPVSEAQPILSTILAISTIEIGTYFVEGGES